jgi:hypothetical protein
LVLQAGGNPSDSFAISNASGLEVHQIADAPKISDRSTFGLLGSPSNAIMHAFLKDKGGLIPPG